jgi:hypothetical protein
MDNYKLGGFLAQEISFFSELEGLFLSKNSLSGPIPKEFGNLKKLSFLHLEYNQLSGDIPAELGQATSLVDLFLNDNSLTGLVPDSLGKISNLTQLYVICFLILFIDIFKTITWRVSCHSHPRYQTRHMYLELNESNQLLLLHLLPLPFLLSLVLQSFHQLHS